LLVGIFGVVVVAIVLIAAGPLAGSDGLVVLAMGFGTLIVLVQNGYALWCLSRRDVQHWMFQRSLGAMGA
jgi:hypothetical protein